MKTGINNSVKRVLSLVLVFAMLIGTLFTANIGINIKADAETDEIDYSTWNIQYWNGRTDKDFAMGDGSEANPYIITNAAELNWVCTCNYNISATTKYYKIDPTIKAFVLQKEDVAKPYLSKIIGSNSSEDTRAFFEDNGLSSNLLNWYVNGSNPFNDNFDGSGVPIYGIYCDAAIKNAENCGLFPALDGGASDYSEAYYEKTVTKITDIAGTESDSVVKYTQTVTQHTADGQIRKDTNGNEIAAVVTNHEGTYEKSTDKTVGGKYAKDSSSVKYTINETGITIKNIVLRNSYFKGYRRVGALTGTTWYQGVGTALALGIANVDACEISNCFLVGQNLRSTGTIVNSHGNGEMGIVGGSLGNDVVKANRLLIFGNESEYRSYADANNYTIDDSLKFNRTFANNGTNPNSTFYGTLTNSIVVDTTVSGLTNNFNEPYVSKNYTFYDVETLRGAAAMAWADTLEWGDTWFAVEGGLPTPIKPESYLSLDKKPTSLYSGGKGTEKDPYIITTVDQLSQMVTEGGMCNGVNSYYKVADGIKELYISDATTYEEATQLASSSSYINWEHGSTEFKGVFDGNGVTIYGMISKGVTYPGFVPVFAYTDVLEPTIKNITFSGAYVYGSAAGTVTTRLGSYVSNDTDGYKHMNYISNIAVIESHIESTETDVGPYVDTNSNQTTHKATAGGILLMSNTPEHVVVSNCLFDGVSSVLKDTLAGQGASEISAKAGIVGMNGGENEYTINNCVAINEYVVPMMTSVANETVPAPVENRNGYYRYASAASGSGTSMSQCYSVLNTNINADKFEMLEILAEVNNLETKDVYAQTDTPLLDWLNTWELVDVEFDETGKATRTIPMPIGVASEDSILSYSNELASQLDNKGASTNSGVPGFYGKYGWQTLFTGSGTEEDPYLIRNALELARAIGSGGESMDYPLYYKLACDIDINGAKWINQTSIQTTYAYVPFTGTLDGAGYSVSNFVATDDNAAGLIPVLDGGTVKNLHIRNSYAGSNGKAGLIAGEVIDSDTTDSRVPTITGCSVEGSTVVSVSGTAGYISAETEIATNSYYTEKNGVKVVATYTDGVPANETIYCVGKEKADNANAEWYRGPDGVVRHLSFAKAHSVTDVDGDGIINETYLPTDAVALRRALVKNENYSNIYGDVNNSGETNISDLAILRYEMADKDYFDMRDGFWRALETRQINIYYGENDNYDAARKLELYLESMVPRLDMNKIVVVSGDAAWGTQGEGTYVHDKNIAILSDGNIYRADKTAENGFEDLEKSAKYALDGTLQIVVGDIGTQYAYEDSAEYYNYEISYDAKNLALWLKGGSFTAVEQAVLDFIANAKPENGEKGIYTVENGSILDKKAYESLKSDGAASSQSYKQAVEVDGTTYYYAWGDEFEGTNTTINSAEWQVRNYKYEEGANGDTGVNNTPATEATTNGNYHNLTSPTVDAVKDLWEVNNGKLTIWRGLEDDYYNSKGASTVDWGYKPVDLDSDVDPQTGKSSFGILVDDEDVYVDPGLIQTANTMLFKQGYAEMRAALPSDGHAFPAWWFYNGTNENNNANYDRILYGKVYEENAAWQTNKAEKVIPGTLSTYKYKAPKAYLEFDIVEFMEGQNAEADATYKTQGLTSYYTQKGIATGKYLSYPQLTIHKNYSLHSTGKTGADDIAISVPNWSDNSLITNTYSNFHNISGDAINNHRYQHIDKYDWTWSGNKLVKKGFTYPNSSNGVDGTVAGAYHIKGGVTKYWTYGFSWWVNESNNTYELTIYVDFNEDGIMQADEKVVVVNQDVDHYHDNDIVRSRGLGEEAKVWNQYAYMLIDNAFYTSNTLGTRTKRGLTGDWSEWAGVTPYTDLLHKGTSTAYSGTSYADKATFDIEYVRVYQENDKRDIVTPDTEPFNNGNHFGY